MASSRTPIDRMLDGLDWTALPWEQQPEDPAIPYATYSGVLVLGDTSLRVYQLSDGRRIIEAGDLAAFFGVDDVAELFAVPGVS